MDYIEHTDGYDLITQREVDPLGSHWHSEVLQDIAKRLNSGSSFPCPFSRNAFRKHLLRFIFVEGNNAGSIRRLGLALTRYVELSRKWDGSLDTAYPLLVAFRKTDPGLKTVKEYHDFGWSVLQGLHEIDPAAWPDDIDRDPATHSWSMCFNGMPLFCNMSHPAHRIRKSRNLGGHFILVINPRERFDAVAGDTPAGRKLRSRIREGIAAYDEAEHCRQLGNYGSGAVEWQQYGVIEENVARFDRCPFLFRIE